MPCCPSSVAKARSFAPIGAPFAARTALAELDGGRLGREAARGQRRGGRARGAGDGGADGAGGEGAGGEGHRRGWGAGRKEK